MKFPRLFIALIFAMLIAGVAMLQSHVVILALLPLAYLFAAVWRMPGEIDMQITRQVTPEFAPHGTPITVKLTVTNQGQPLDEVTVRDILPEGVTLISGEISRTMALATGSSIEIEYTVQAIRGAYTSYELLVAARDMTGLFERKQFYRTNPRLFVHPHYPKLARIKIRPPQTRGFAGPIAARQAGTGVDFWGVREYQSGDQQRQINWKLGARMKDELYTNVYEQERVADVGIIVDARQRLNALTPEGSLFEHSVRAAASLAENFLDAGNRVSLLVYGAGMERVFPGYGRLHRNRVLRVLSGANPAINYALETLDYLPTRLFPAQSQIVLVSPMSTEDIPMIVRMRAHGYAVMIVSPDPIAYEAAQYTEADSAAFRLAYAERELMLRQIRRCGAQVINWRVNQPLEGAIRQFPAHQSPVYGGGVL